MKFIGSRDEPRDISGKWPSDALASAIERHDLKKPENKNIKMGLVDCKNATDEALEVPSSYPYQSQFERFAPEIYVAGLGLLRERRNEEKWGGVLVRAVQTMDETRRCLQYFYVYLRQNGVVSAFWNVFLPIALGLWGIFILEYLIPSLDLGHLIAAFPELLLTIPMIPFLSAIRPHYDEFLEGQQISFRSMTLLPVYFVLMASSVYFPIMAYLLMALGGALGFYWILEWRGWAGTSHNMDYVPVFVYLKRKGNVWLFDHALWDVWHYHTGSTKNPFNIFRQEAFQPFKRLTLTIDNPWHSMYRGIPPLKGRNSTIIFVLIFAASLVGVLSSIFNLAPLDELLYLLPLWCFLFVATGLLLARKPYPLLTDEERKSKLEAPAARLDDKEKLISLWNLFEVKNLTFLRKIRLRIIKSRMQGRKKWLHKKLEEFDRIRILEVGVVDKLWNAYQVQGMEAVEQLTEEDELTIKEQSELDSENLREELALIDKFKEDLENYDRVKTNPRLVIVQKMQNPFREADYFMDTFRDSEEFLYELIPFDDAPESPLT
ncbi:MAG: hypothetical protein ACXAEF_09020 [Candidatus Thorarchaeota archaeon]